MWLQSPSVFATCDFWRAVNRLLLFAYCCVNISSSFIISSWKWSLFNNTQDNLTQRFRIFFPSENVTISNKDKQPIIKSVEMENRRFNTWFMDITNGQNHYTKTPNSVKWMFSLDTNEAYSRLFWEFILNIQLQRTKLQIKQKMVLFLV